jgi:hypothetical protein
VRLAVGVAVLAAVLHRLRDDLAGAVVSVRMPDQVADRERHVHHQALHRKFLLGLSMQV